MELLGEHFGPGRLGQYLIANQRGTQLPLGPLRLGPIGGKLFDGKKSAADEDVGESGLLDQCRHGDCPSSYGY